MSANRSFKSRAAAFGKRARSRLAANGPSLLLASLAAGLSYFIAGFFFHGGQPFFAPIAAVICMGLAAGQRIRRAAEIVIGVALGLLAADLFIYTVGSGPLQLAGAVLLASGAAVALLGARNLVSNQAAVAAVLVVALLPVDANPFGPFGRLLEALIGGGTALAINTIFTRDPLRTVRHAGSQIIEGLDSTLGEICAAIDDHDLARAEAALEATHAVARSAQDFDQAVSAARETARLARYRRGLVDQLRPLVAVRSRLDILVSTLRGLSRATANALRYGHDVPSSLSESLTHLSGAFRELDQVMMGQAAPEAAHREALEAARLASAVLDTPHHLTSSVMVGQVRSAAVDILRATGVKQREAIRQLEEAAGRADRSA